MIRRSFSLCLVLLPPVFFLGLALAVSVAVWQGHPQLVVTLMIVVCLPLFVIVSARYLAHDRLREGFRYRRAWHAFRAHSRPGLQVTGYVLLTSLAWRALHVVVLRLDYAPRVGAWILLAVVWASVQLIGAHLQGQFVAAAYAAEGVPDSV